MPDATPAEAGREMIAAGSRQAAARRSPIADRQDGCAAWMGTRRARRLACASGRRSALRPEIVPLRERPVEGLVGTQPPADVRDEKADVNAKDDW
jgi:hypothetical protein